MKQLFITSVRDFEKNTMGTVEMREMPMPEPAEDEVRIKIIYSSICGSDAHTLTGHLGEFEEGTKAMLPMTFGHELSGVIDQGWPEGRSARLSRRRQGHRQLRQILLRLRQLPQRA